MTHREFLFWLRPRLEKATSTGLSREEVAAIGEELERMRAAGALQPFASRLQGLLSDPTALDGDTVAGLAAEVRTELAPPRERTMVAWAVPDKNDKSAG